MPKNLEKPWKTALTCIINELDESQYQAMLEILRKIPKAQRTRTRREKMAQIIIEHYGEEESVSAVRDAMEQIPRRDPEVQDLLRPFVEKPRNKGELTELLIKSIYFNIIRRRPGTLNNLCFHL